MARKHSSVVFVSAVILVLFLAAAVFLFYAPPASAQTARTAIGTVSIALYGNYTDGSSGSLGTSTGNVVPASVVAPNGKVLSNIEIVVTDSLTLKGATVNSVVLSATQPPGILTVFPVFSGAYVPDQVPAKYNLAASQLGPVNVVISVTISAATASAAYTGTTPSLTIQLKAGEATSTASSSTATVPSTTTTVVTTGTVVSGTYTSATATVTELAYPYGLPQTYTSGDGHAWTLMTCSAAESYWSVSSCDHLTSVYSISPTVTYVSSANDGTYMINGQQCSIATSSTSGQATACWAAFISGTPGSTAASLTGPGTVYGFGDYMPSGYYGA